MELDTIYNMDCLEGMKQIPDGMIDAVICDLPYGTMKGIVNAPGWENCSCEWDEIIPTDKLFIEYERVLRKGGTIDLICTDPPYNIGKEKELGKTWDIIENYQEWMLEVFKECERVLKPNGVLYFFHNDIPQMFRLMNNLEDNTSFFFNSFCVWYKEGWRANSYSQTGREDANYVLRQWFNVCEYFAEYWKMGEIETDNKTSYLHSLKILNDFNIFNLKSDF